MVSDSSFHVIPALSSPDSPPWPSSARAASTPRGSLQSARLDAQSQPRAGITRESLAGSSRRGSGALGRTLNLFSERTTLQTRSQLSQLLCQAAEEGMAFGAGTAAPPRAMWATKHGMPGTAKSSSSLIPTSEPAVSPRTQKAELERIKASRAGGSSGDARPVRQPSLSCQGWEMPRVLLPVCSP